MKRADGYRPLRLFGLGRTVRREVSEEFAFHLKMTEQELIDRGWHLEAAREEALRRFGNLTRHQKACRAIGERRRRSLRRGEIMNDFLLDLKFALRTFRQSPGFVAVAVVTLALGISANANIFGMVNGMVLTPLPFEEPGELTVVWAAFPERGITKNSASVPDYIDWRDRNQVFDDLAAHTFWQVNLTGLDRPRRLTGYRVTGNLFDLLGVEPLLGRTFLSEEDEPGGDRVVVISYRLWNGRFGADRSLLGRTITLDGISYTVIGVMPPKFEFPQFQFRGDLWVPIQLTAQQMTEQRGRRFLTVVGRLRDGVTLGHAQTEMDQIAVQVEKEYPRSNTGLRTNLIGLQQQVAEPIRPALLILPVMVGFVLMICCANVANLLLARASSRSGEIAIRNALGASRGRVIRQLLTESLIVALLGGVAGFLLSRLTDELIVASLPDFVLRVAPSAVESRSDARVLLFALAISVLTGVIFGLAPALRYSNPNLQEALKGGGTSATGEGRSNRLRSALVVGEVALSVILLVGAGLMIKGFVNLLEVDPGFTPERVLTLETSLPEAGYGGAEERRNFYRDVLKEIATLPGVESAGAANILPLSFRNTSGSFLIEGRPEPEPGQYPQANFRVVTPDYFTSMEMQLLRGRAITEQDTADARPVVVVNESLVRRYLPEDDPLGQRIRNTGDSPWMEIVGVVEDVRHSSLAFGPDPEMYLPYEQRPRLGMMLAIRTAVEPMSIAEAVSQKIWSVDPDQPVDAVQTLTELVSVSLFVFRMPAYFMAVFASAALLLAAVGLYGVMSYLVAQRTREIGVRIVLGAKVADVIGLVVRRALLLAAIGIALGTAAGLAVARVLASLLEGVEGTEASVFFGVPLLLAAVAFLAAYLPARRASSVDPMVALHSE